MTAAVYVDTAWLVALIDRSDNLRSQALDLARKLAARAVPLITTDAVLIELGNYFARSPLRIETGQWISEVRSAEGWEIVPVDSDLLARSEGRYRSFADKTWSVTDCIGMELMQKRGLRDAATTDVGFHQAGFRVLLEKAAG